MTKAGLSRPESHLHCLIQLPAEDIGWNRHITETKEVLTLMFMRIISQDVVYSEGDLHLGIMKVLRSTMEAVNKSLKGANEIALNVANIMHYCKDQAFESPANPGKKTAHWELLQIILEEYNRMNSQNIEVLKPMMADVKEMCEYGDKELKRYASDLLKTIKHSPNAGLLGEDQAEAALNRYLEEDDTNIVYNLSAIYKTNPSVIEKRLDQILEKLRGGEDGIAHGTVNLFHTVARENVKVITESHVDTIVQYTDGDTTKHLACFFLQYVAPVHPDWVGKHTDKMIAAIRTDAQLSIYLASTLASVACMDKVQAEKITKFLAGYIPTMHVTYRICMITSGLKPIATKHRDVVAKYRSVLEDAKKDLQLQEYYQGVIDVLEGRTLENLDSKVKQMEKYIAYLVKKMESMKDVRHGKDGEEKVDERMCVEDLVVKTTEQVEDTDNRVPDPKDAAESNFQSENKLFSVVTSCCACKHHSSILENLQERIQQLELKLDSHMSSGMVKNSTANFL